MTSPGPVLEAHGLRFSYPGHAGPALDGADLEVRAGEVVVVTGRSGCGKSTLGRAVCGLLPQGPLHGSVSIDGKDARMLEPFEFGSLAAYAQQDPDSQLVSLRVDEEVAFGLENMGVPRTEMRRRVARALADAGALHLASRDTLSLSGGEKQRVAIAAMLAMRPRLLVLDEPTSSLDPPATASLAALCSRLAARGMGVVVLEHRVAHFLPVASRVLAMESGRMASTDARTADTPAIQPSRSIHPGSGETLLEARNLGHSRDGQQVLRGVNLRIGAGESVGLMGANGCGKTTLALCLMNLLEGWTGDVSIMGAPSRGRRTSELARSAGLVFQNPSHQLFEMTVAREMAVGPEALGAHLEVAPWSASKRGGRRSGDEGEGDDERWLRSVAEEHGLGSVLERAPQSLSHGQKRRVNLASVASMRPRLLILDEPFIGQDAATASDIAERIRAHAAGGGGALVILHDASLARRCCDRIAFMENGRLRFDLPAEAAFAEFAKDPALAAWGVR